MKLANYFDRQFTDHISTFEWDNTGLDNWRWRMESESFDTVGIVRVPMTDPMCLGTPRALLTLNEIMDWQMHATTQSCEFIAGIAIDGTHHGPTVPKHWCRTGARLLHLG